MHTFAIQGLEIDLRLVQFSGVEAMSQHFRFDVTALAAEGDIAPGDVIGKPATLTFNVGKDARFLNGIIARVEQGEEDKKVVAHRFVIVPTVHCLLFRHDLRIFQEMTAVDVVKKVLDDAGISSDEVGYRTDGSYPKREYCVQYRESDWDFIARLCEEEGISFFFEHADGKHKLVFVDSPNGLAPIAGKQAVPFHIATGALVQDEAVSVFRVAAQIGSDEITLRDWDFKRPTVLLEGTSTGKVKQGLAVYDFPAEALDSSDAKRLSKVRLEEATTESRVGRGDSNVPRLMPGAVFELTDHPIESLSGKWIVVEVDHVGHEPSMTLGSDAAPYGNRFRAVPAGTPIRPARVTRRPIVHGSHTAIVTGPAGEEVHVDEHGRIKVQFHWDRLGKKDEKTTCWIRVAQAWSGPAYGAMFLPRIGHEVVVSFLEGDPDRPLVTGSVYNAANVPPYALPAEKTKSTIKTRSSPGGSAANFNELRFEDKKGQEEILIHAEKDHTIEVENDENEHIGHDQSVVVDNDRTRRVGANETVTVGASRKLTVGVDETDVIGANWAATVGANATVSIATNLSVTLGGAFTQSVAKAATISIGEGKEESIAKGSTRSVGEDDSVTIDGSSTTEVGKSLSLSVAKDASMDVDGAYALTVGKSYALECGDGKITVQKNGDILIEGKKIVVKGSGPIELQGSKLTIKSDGAVEVKASGNVAIKGSAISAN
jgi:type VI secretion system secreted protein VgrG